MQEKYPSELFGTDKFLSLGSCFGITLQSLLMPNRDPREGNFCLHLTSMKDTYILALVNDVVIPAGYARNDVNSNGLI